VRYVGDPRTYSGLSPTTPIANHRPYRPEFASKTHHRGAAIVRKLSSKQAGTLGELLTVAKLNTLGHAAYMSPEGAPGHDVMVVVSGHPRSIEVKTRQYRRLPSEITRWPMDMQTKGDADFFIFIELDLRTLSPTFYLLTNTQAHETFRDYRGGGNCYPPTVRRLVTANDFSALEPQESLPVEVLENGLALLHGERL
jgi:hypothetical protein